MDIFPVISRCLIVVKPKQPLVDWINKLDPTNPVTLEEAQYDSSSFLLPTFDEILDPERTVESYLKSNYQGIFLQELSDWYLDPKAYPKMTYSHFLEWFEISTHSMVFDMVNGPITKYNL